MLCSDIDITATCGRVPISVTPIRRNPDFESKHPTSFDRDDIKAYYIMLYNITLIIHIIST